MGNCLLDQFLQVTDVVGIASCKKSKACNKRKSYRIDRIVNIWLRQRFCLHAQLERRRSLSLCQPIYSVIEYDVDHIDISSPCAHQVTSTNSKAIAVSPHRDNLKFRICKFGSLCEWQHPAVQRMDAICLDKVRRLTRTSDAGKNRSPVWRNLQICKCHLDGIQYSEVATARAPIIVNICLVI